MKGKTGILLAFSLALLSMGQESNQTETQNKSITLINSHTTADGLSQVQERVLEECIVSLPEPQQLTAEVVSDARYLKHINDDPDRNEFIRFYKAKVEVNYMVYQKSLIIVTSNSVPAQEPVMKVVEKKIRETKLFESRESHGDIFAGRSDRMYYFSSEQAAVADALERAKIWLEQQAPIVCDR